MARRRKLAAGGGGRSRWGSNERGDFSARSESRKAPPENFVSDGRAPRWINWSQVSANIEHERERLKLRSPTSPRVRPTLWRRR
jgi:hypothetical protein